MNLISACLSSQAIVLNARVAASRPTLVNGKQLVNLRTLRKGACAVRWWPCGVLTFTHLIDVSRSPRAARLVLGPARSLFQRFPNGPYRLRSSIVVGSLMRIGFPAVSYPLPNCPTMHQNLNSFLSALPASPPRTPSSCLPISFVTADLAISATTSPMSGLHASAPSLPRQRIGIV